jgi:hypothetical protein
MASVLALAFFPGCDGSDPDPLTRAEYIAQADRICVTQEVSVTTLDGKEIEFPSGGSPSANRDYADDKESILDDLEALAPPSADREVIDAWLAARQQQIDLLREGAEAQESKDDSRVRALTDQFGAARRRELAAARDYGMKFCSRPAGMQPAPAQG